MTVLARREVALAARVFAVNQVSSEGNPGRRRHQPDSAIQPGARGQADERVAQPEPEADESGRRMRELESDRNSGTTTGAFRPRSATAGRTDPAPPGASPALRREAVRLGRAGAAWAGAGSGGGRGLDGCGDRGGGGFGGLSCSGGAGAPEIAG